MESTSVLLHPKTGAWHPDVLSMIKGGIRVVDVHLFAGGRRKIAGTNKPIGDKVCAEKRAFQLHSMFSTVDYWNDGLTRGRPVTIYAGDFNTYSQDRKLIGTQLSKLVSKSEKLFNLNMQCGPSRRCAGSGSPPTTLSGQSLDHIMHDDRHTLKFKIITPLKHKVT
jgi:endonuclease/exonuclease/phosphatase family metal-dependent hydrolase